jgi:hypothetical protein
MDPAFFMHESGGRKAEMARLRILLLPILHFQTILHKQSSLPDRQTEDVNVAYSYIMFSILERRERIFTFSIGRNAKGISQEVSY